MFEKALFESTHRTAPRGRLRFLAVALLAHLLALGALTAAQAWAVEPVEEPTIFIACELGGYLDAPEPVPPPPRPAVPRGSGPAVQPTAIPDRLPPPGQREDLVRNRGTGRRARPRHRPTKRHEHRDGGGDTPSHADTRARGRAARLQGRRRRHGARPRRPGRSRLPRRRPCGPQAGRRPGPGRDPCRRDRRQRGPTRDGVGFGAFDAIRDAVLLWRYQPARSGGRTVPVWIDITVSFRLT